jgi:hypothetical protein
MNIITSDLDEISVRRALRDCELLWYKVDLRTGTVVFELEPMEITKLEVVRYTFTGVTRFDFIADGKVETISHCKLFWLDDGQIYLSLDPPDDLCEVDESDGCVIIAKDFFAELVPRKNSSPFV